MTRNVYPWIRSIRQLALIVLAAAAIALISNHFRSSPLPLVGNWSQEARLTSPSGRQMAISLDEAKNLHQSNGAVFMDARPLEEFAKGHVQGAISLPWHEAEQRVMDVIADMANDAVIITYCDGDDLQSEQGTGAVSGESGVFKSPGTGQRLVSMAECRTAG